MEPLSLTTTDGVTLEAQRHVPDGATVGVVLAHPHPLYGGSMWDGPPAWLFDALPAAGMAAVRFQFRAEHDEGRAEQLDLVAAIDALPAGLPIVLCGYSFGGWVSLHVTDQRVRSWVAIAPPLRGDVPAAADPRPKHLLVPEHDQYTPPNAIEPVVAGWTATTYEVLRGTDHFLGGAMRTVVDHVVSAIHT
ncbi:MAG TPA: alpha/beta fold hydrolase [Acidimicrobiales bacterium]|nr:alpha/beta fold hydrolase [Acidimicrobiales bacterium]